MCVDGLSGYAITNRLRPELPAASLNNARWQSSFLFVPGGVPAQPALSPDCAIRPITMSEKPIHVPLESIEAGTTVGLFVDDALVSWVEATPLPTVTEHFGVMLVGIETMEGFRHRGYASAVLGELTRRMLDMGRVPLYACAQNNVASQRTALSCGYMRYGECYRLQLAVDR
jgi:hypothetical protein